MRHLLETLQSERAERRGYVAWRLGDLDTAVASLEAAVAMRPGALLPLARALAERGEARRALEVLDEAERAGASDAARMFRAIVLHDEGELDRARVELARLPTDNLLARAFTALVETAETGATTLDVPPAALWLADVAGRWLERLEREFVRATPEAALAYHHTVLTGVDGATAAASETRAKTPARPRLSDARAWSAWIDSRFAAGDFSEVVAAHRSADASDWHDLHTAIEAAFALLARGAGDEASSLASQWLGARPGSPELHFIDGLAHSAAGRVKDAGWSFVRLARLADTDVHHLMRHIERSPGAYPGSPVGPRPSEAPAGEERR